VNSQRCLWIALLLSLTVGSGISAASSSPVAAWTMSTDQAAGGESGTCPLRAADFDKLTPYRWKVAQYKANRGFIPNGTIRIDYCELIGSDDKGTMRTGVMVNVAKGANAEAFAKHWRAVCAGSLMPDARGKVQPVPGAAGGYQCVTAKGTSSVYWIESPGQTIQLEPESDDLPWAKILPQLLAAMARPGR
jgi:hypothetical protein